MEENLLYNIQFHHQLSHQHRRGVSELDRLARLQPRPPPGARHKGRAAQPGCRRRNHGPPAGRQPVGLVQRSQAHRSAARTLVPSK